MAGTASSAASVSGAIDALIASPQHRVEAVLTTEYRNKITYSLSPCQRFQTSNLAMPQLNDICVFVHKFACETSGMPHEFWREVTVKTTLTSQTMLKLSFNTEHGAMEAWGVTELEPATSGIDKPGTDGGTTSVEGGQSSSDACKEASVVDTRVRSESEAASFLQRLNDTFPDVKSVVFQHSEGKARPTKTDLYRRLHGLPWVVEATPNGVPFKLRADTFSEINHSMERRVFSTLLATTSSVTQDILDGAIPTAIDDRRPLLLVFGRNVNSLVFGFLADERIHSVHAITHCPLAAHDLEMNLRGAQAHSARTPVRVSHMEREEMGSTVMNGIDDEGGKRAVVCVITSGRHGIHWRLARALRDKPNIVSVAYDSCNVVSLKRVMDVFMDTPAGREQETDARQTSAGFLRVASFQSFDFFPGTQYTASVTHLVKGDGGLRTLVLPVGPAGAGKSTLGAALAAGFPSGAVVVWERDRVFSAMRNGGLGLTKTKKAVHAELMATLGKKEASLIYLDSTNGSREARGLYSRTFCAGGGRRSMLVLVCFMMCGEVDDQVHALTARTNARVGHPSFPEEPADIEAKHRNILSGLEYPSSQDVERELVGPDDVPPAYFSTAHAIAPGDDSIKVDLRKCALGEGRPGWPEMIAVVTVRADTSAGTAAGQPPPQDVAEVLWRLCAFDHMMAVPPAKEDSSWIEKAIL